MPLCLQVIQHRLAPRWNAGLRGERSATTRLGHGTAMTNKMYLNYAIYHFICHRTEKLLGPLYGEDSLNAVAIENNKDHMCVRAEQN